MARYSPKTKIQPQQWSVNNYIMCSMLAEIFANVHPTNADKKFVTDYISSALLGCNSITQAYYSLPEAVRKYMPKNVVDKVDSADSNKSYTPPHFLLLFEQDFLEVAGKYEAMRAMGIKG